MMIDESEQASMWVLMAHHPESRYVPQIDEPIGVYATMDLALIALDRKTNEKVVKGNLTSPTNYYDVVQVPFNE